MKKFKEVTTRHLVIGGREFNTGATVRVVAISDRDAAVLNGMSTEKGVEYLPVDSEEIKKINESTDGLVRGELLAIAEKRGLQVAKNISTAKLKSIVDAVS